MFKIVFCFICISSTLFSLQESEVLTLISLKKHMIESSMKEAEENDTRIYYYLQGCYDQLCELETYIMLSVDHKY